MVGDSSGKTMCAPTALIREVSASGDDSFFMRYTMVPSNKAVSNNAVASPDASIKYHSGTFFFIIFLYSLVISLFIYYGVAIMAGVASGELVLSSPVTTGGATGAVSASGLCSTSVSVTTGDVTGDCVTCDD
jgi:hypothetical protein